MTNNKVYTGTDVIPMLNHHWMVDTTGQMRGAVRPIRIIDNRLYLLDERGEAMPASRDLHVILQGSYIVYNPIDIGDWVKIDNGSEILYGKVKALRHASHVSVVGNEGAWYSIGKCEKISREQANRIRCNKLFEINGRSPHEYRHGDVVRTYDKKISTVKRVLDSGMVTLHGFSGSFMPGQLDIIAFAHNCVDYPKLVATSPMNRCNEIVQPDPFAAPMPQQTLVQPMPQQAPCDPYARGGQY